MTLALRKDTATIEAHSKPGLPTTIVEDSVSDAKIRTLVGQLNAVCRRNTLSFAISIGEVVVRELYGGDLAVFRQRLPHKKASLRKLANHPDLAISPAALYRSISFYELFARMGGRKWEHLSTSHLRLVLPIPPSDQERLLESAEAQRWSVERLDREVALLDGAQTARGGRRRRSALVTAVASLQKALLQISELLKRNADASPESEREVTVLLERALRVKERLLAKEGRIDM